MIIDKELLTRHINCEVKWVQIFSLAKIIYCHHETPIIIKEVDYDFCNKIWSEIEK